ncbi:hypothetical protein AAC387_Pa06g1461 [Persea americana]
MKRLKSEAPGGRRLKLSHFLIGIAALYLVFISVKFPQFLEMAMMLSGNDSFADLHHSPAFDHDEPYQYKPLFSSVEHDAFNHRLDNQNQSQSPKVQTGGSQQEDHNLLLYSHMMEEVMRRQNKTSDLQELEKMADEAWLLGLKAWEEVEGYKFEGNENEQTAVVEGKSEPCPSSVSLSGEELVRAGDMMFLPCGLAGGSSITILGTPHVAHEEYVPQLARLRHGDGRVLISQFKVELQGLKAVDGEDPPKILHLNPRLKGDWSQRPVIEHNTCYRMQWGRAQRCEGIHSFNDDDLVDGLAKCEKWVRSDVIDPKESKTTSWLRRFIGRAKKPEMTWPFPFVEGRMFVLTIQAGVEGYHIYVGGRHVTSFAYRTGFSLEDATGLEVKGDVDVHSIYATSLPLSHRSFSLQRVLEMSEKWQSYPLPRSPIQLFIGILSASNHFAERMAIRKTWMQSAAIKSSEVVARFFVALNQRNEVNAALKKEADYFGDTLIIPFMDRYELVVLKTLAICEYGVYNLSAAYIMKSDDDTFIRVDSVLKEIDRVKSKSSLYMGNLNLMHRPLRSGKWAVTYEEWPEAVYPPYANGPGYIISNDIARFITSQYANQSLRLFKMEDVSMGLWVEQFNSSKTVQYSHNWKFCQFGCLENYFTAHYQSPRQMICLWGKLGRGWAHCCNFR